MTHIMGEDEEKIVIYANKDGKTVDFSWTGGDEEFYKRFTVDEACKLLDTMEKAIEKITLEKEGQ